MTTAICADLMGMVGEQVEAIRTRQYWMELYVNRYHNTYQAFNQIVNNPELNAIHKKLINEYEGNTMRYAQPYIHAQNRLDDDINHLHLITEIIHGDPDYDSEYDTDTDDDY